MESIHKNGKLWPSGIGQRTKIKWETSWAFVLITGELSIFFWLLLLLYTNWQKIKQFFWKNECEKVFRQMKLTLCSSPILAYPRHTGAIYIEIIVHTIFILDEEFRWLVSVDWFTTFLSVCRLPWLPCWNHRVGIFVDLTWFIVLGKSQIVSLDSFHQYFHPDKLCVTLAWMLFFTIWAPIATETLFFLLRILLNNISRNSTRIIVLVVSHYSNKSF